MASKMVRGGLCLGFGLCSALSVSSSAAQSRPSKQGTVQLSLDGSLLKYQTQTLTSHVPAGYVPGGSGSSDTTVQTKLSSTTFGPAGSGLGFGLGYAASDLVIIGLRTSYSSWGGASDLAVLPRLELMFDGDGARIFVSGMVGLGSSSTTQEQDTQPNVDVTRTAYLYGVSAGVHAFVSDTFSLDPSFTLLGFSGSTTSKTTPSGEKEVSTTADVSGIQAMLTFGFSAWLGGKPPAPPPALPEAAAVETAADAEEEEKPASVDIHLPGHRGLFLQLPKDVTKTSLVVRLAEPPEESALATCDDVAVFDSGGPLKMRIRTHAGHVIVGRFSVRALELLATTDANLSVCANQWQLGQESREQIDAFLKQRRSKLAEAGHPEQVPAAATPASSRPADPPLDSSAAPVNPIAPAPGQPAPSAPLPVAPAPAAPGAQPKH